MDAVTAYEQARMHLDLVESEKQVARNTILAQVQGELDALDEEFADKLAQCASDLANAETQVKAAVLIAGQTVKGEHVTAVYTEGRKSVDVKRFEGYVDAHPELKHLLKRGEPSVSIRWVR